MNERKMHLQSWHRDEKGNLILNLVSEEEAAVLGFMDDLSARGWHFDAAKNTFIHESEVEVKG